MKISPIALSLSANKRIYQNQNDNSSLKLKSLNCDTISFGYYSEISPDDIQVYRCISEDEYQKLSNDGCVKSNIGYVTSSPKGWRGQT